eukprot:758840-Hanusia_phi.AAC.3
MASTNAILAVAPVLGLGSSLTSAILSNVVLGAVAARFALLEWSWREETLYLLPTVLAGESEMGGDES